MSSSGEVVCASETTGLWGFILYCTAVLTALFMYHFYEKKEEKRYLDDGVENVTVRNRSNDFRLSSLYAALGLKFGQQSEYFTAFEEHFNSFEEVSQACSKAGLETTRVIIGVDFTASNEWQGRKSFNQNCLHKIVPNKIYNPYQKVIWVLGQTLAPFTEGEHIPTFGFGDNKTADDAVFPFRLDESSCHGFTEVLECYNDIAKRVTLGGPTSFAPIINKAIELVEHSGKYHILVIVADGQVTEEKPTIDAIVEASYYPISIIVIGVGDGPWEVMEEFDHRLPKRKFDNFRFVDYHKATHKSKNPDMALALQALMEVPDQFKTIRALGYLGDVASRDSGSLHSTPSGSPHTVRKEDGFRRISTESFNERNLCERRKVSVTTSV